MIKNDKKKSAIKVTGTKKKAAPKKKTVVKKKGSSELEKSKVHIIVEIIEYMSNAVVSKTILKKTTGNVTVSSFAIGEELEEKITPFDLYIQIIDGAAEVIIDKKVFLLKKGDGIIIPAHTVHCFNAKEQFKMVSTVIKSGYEE